MTEAEAAEALAYLAQRLPGEISTDDLLDQAPVDDEPFGDEDERAVTEVRSDSDRVSLAQARAELL